MYYMEIGVFIISKNNLLNCNLDLKNEMKDKKRK